MRLRGAALDDIEALVALQQASPGAAPWSAPDYESLLSANTTVCLLAEDEDKDEPVGFVLARLVADELEILNLAVAPARRRRGLGRRLVAEALARGRVRGAEKCWLEVRASNRAALDFYLALGFREHSRRGAYYRNPVEDAVVCVRQLTAAAGP
ncbi:MAG: ribosomal protein S18-alanine N-acetyltransferase [Candidatus Acidiferrales bacterium]